MYYRYVPLAHRGGFTPSPLTFPFSFLQVFEFTFVPVRIMSYTAHRVHRARNTSVHLHVRIES